MMLSSNRFTTLQAIHTGQTNALPSTLSTSLRHQLPDLFASPRLRASAARAAAQDDFEVVGTKIYDPSGREFIAKGVNINGPGYGWPGKTPEQVSNIKRWGFNAIRLNVRELGLDDKTRYSENGTIDQIVTNYTRQGIVVIIEPHERTGKWFSSTELQALTTWHTTLASKYKNNPYVWLNVSNEPGGFDSGTQAAIQTYLAQNQTVINAVRATGFDNPIVVDGWFWGQDSGTWNSNPVTESKSAILSLGARILASDPEKNTVFSVHCYDQWRFGQAKMDNFIDRVHNKGLALMIGEYGAENGNSGRFKDTVMGVLPSAQQKEVGRFAWAWQGGDAFDLTTSGGGYKANFQANGSMPDNLSWFGQQVWRDTHRRESLQPRPVPPTMPTTPTRMTIEAESMALAGYRSTTIRYASGGGLVSLAADTGSASILFPGVSGQYNLVLHYVDETDGQSTFTVKVNGSPVGRAIANQDLGSDAIAPQTLTSKTIARGVTVNHGQRITITGTRDQTEYARLDAIQLVPV